MLDQLIAEVVEEIAPQIRGRALGKVWQLGRDALAFDFRLNEGRFLFVSCDPSRPRLHLVERRGRDLERQSQAPSQFLLALRRHAGGAVVRAVTKDARERVVRFSFDAEDEAGRRHSPILVAQLTGRTANLFLLEDGGRVVETLRPVRGEGQLAGDVYSPPARGTSKPGAGEPGAAGVHAGGAGDGDSRAGEVDAEEAGAPSVARARPAVTRADAARPSLRREGFPSLSAALDAHHLALEEAQKFDARVSAHRARLRREIERRRKLDANLARDSAAHGDPAEHKRVGDLLLANLSTAERDGARVRVLDYFAEDAPAVELEIDEHATLREEAARRFALYARAKRAAQEIDRRRAELTAELAPLEARRAELERVAATRDADALTVFEEAASDKKGSGRGSKVRKGNAKATEASAKGVRRGVADFASAGGAKAARSRKQSAEAVAGARRYLSSDGYEILVGRAARDNDQLTFKVARPHDLWLHAADYPGSHVVVRNHARNTDIPQRTVHEAAQLAAHFSQARGDARVAVNYAQRKFLSKPKGAAPGLVRMSSFKTLLVEPRESVERVL
jgi:predicted ribosome quality control (RQC) complex YloA/Tae2 family protein